MNLSFLRKPAAPQPRPSGVPVPLSARPIPAYTLLMRDHFVNYQTGELEVQYFPEAAVKQLGFITDLSRIIGRGLVLSHDKAAGYAFTEKDFFPEHTLRGRGGRHSSRQVRLCRPGRKDQRHPRPQAGRSLRSDSDLAGRLGKDVGEQPDGQPAQRPGPGAVVRPPPAEARSSTVLVQNGLIILPVAVREVPLSSPSSNNPNERPKTRPIQEATIAVGPHEVTQLNEALVVHAELICVAPRDGPRTRAPA